MYTVPLKLILFASGGEKLYKNICTGQIASKNTSLQCKALRPPSKKNLLATEVIPNKMVMEMSYSEMVNNMVLMILRRMTVLEGRSSNTVDTIYMHDMI